MWLHPEFPQWSGRVLTYDLTPHGVAVGGIQLTQVEALVWGVEDGGRP